MNNIIYIFLDIDGVLNSQNYLIKRYNVHRKPMSMNAVPFDPQCLYNLMLFVQILIYSGYEPKLVLSSTWRLHDIDYEIVDSRLAEYGLRLVDKTPVCDHQRGVEIQQYLNDKQYNNIIIFDDESFDIKQYFKDNLVQTNPMYGLSYKDVRKAISVVLGGDIMSNWNDTMVDKEMTLNDAINYVDDMYQQRMSSIQQDNTIHVDLLDKVKFTNLEFASVRLLREVQSLQSKIDNSIEIKKAQDMLDNISQYFMNNPNISQLELYTYIVSHIISLINKEDTND